MFKLILLSLFLIVSQLFILLSFAQDEQACGDRYLTLVNPVRSRDLWLDKSLKPLQDQYNLINKNSYKALGLSNMMS